MQADGIKTSGSSAVKKTEEVPRLVKLLGSKSDADAASDALKDLTAKGAERRAEVIDAGGLAALIALCKGESTRSQESAIGSLLNIGCTEKHRPAMTKAGALGAAVHVLKSQESTPRAKSWACGVSEKIGKGADKEKQWQQVFDAGVLPLALAVIKDGTEDGKTRAANLLKDWTSGHQPVRQPLIDAGGLEPLVKLCKEGTAKQSEPAIGCFLNIGCTPACRPAMTKSGCLDAAVAVMKSASASKQAQGWAAAVAGKIGSGHDEEKQWKLVFDSGAVPLALAVMKDGEEDGKTRASEMMKDLTSGFKECRQPVIAAGGLEVILALASKGKPKQQEPACGCLLNIGCTVDCRPAMTKAGTVAAMVSVLKTSNATKTAKGWACAVCQKIGNGDDEKQWQLVFDAGVLPLALAVIKDGTEDGKTRASEMLKDFTSNHKECRQPLIDAGGLEPLVKLCKEGTAKQSEPAIGCFLNISCTKECISALKDAGCLAAVKAAMAADKATDNSKTWGKKVVDKLDA